MWTRTYFVNIWHQPAQPRLNVYPARLIGKRPWHFQASWYVNRPWLEYSQKVAAAFCFPYRVYGRAAVKDQEKAFVEVVHCYRHQNGTQLPRGPPCQTWREHQWRRQWRGILGFYAWRNCSRDLRLLWFRHWTCWWQLENDRLLACKTWTELDYTRVIPWDLWLNNKCY